MFYHASQTKDIKVLEPHVSMHGKSYVYFSSKKENVLVYLSNPVEKFILKKYNRPMKEYKKWASYGFTQDGKLRLEEYYPNALVDTFKGVTAYIYKVENLPDKETINDIANVYISTKPVKVDDFEIIEDAYDEILKAEQEGKLVVERYEQMSEKKKEMIKKMITSEFENTENSDYKDFLLTKFQWLDCEKTK